MEAGQAEALRETLEQLRAEVAELHACRERLIRAADDDRRAIERELHDGVQQQLVALAVNLQLARPLVEGDPAAAKELLEEMARDVESALDESARLAQRLYPPLLEARGLAAALRAAATSAGVSVSVDVAPGLTCAPEVAWTIYLCWLQALEDAVDEARPAVTVRAEGGAVAFEVVAELVPPDTFLRLRDRVEVLGGRLTISPQLERGIRVSGSLPLSRAGASRSRPGRESRP